MMQTPGALTAAAQYEVPAHVPADRVVDFDIYNPAAAGQDYYDGWRSFQDNAADLVWTPRNGGHWIATRGPLIRTIFEDFAHFSNQIQIVPRERGDDPRTLPARLDPPVHGSYRALMNTAISPATIRNATPQIRELGVAIIERLQPLGQCDFVAEYAHKLPIGAFLKMANLPAEDAEEFKLWVDRIVVISDFDIKLVWEWFDDYLRPIVRQRRITPGTDIISTMVNGRIKGEIVGESEATMLATQLLIGGVDTVATLLAFVMQYLARSESTRAFLLNNPDQIPAVSEEFVRRFPTVTNVRVVRDDFVFENVTLKKGDAISMPSALIAVDEREFGCPFDVDLSRKPVGHTTFGRGIHSCPGSFLARTELQLMLETWLPRIPNFSVADNAALRVRSGVTSGLAALPLRWSV